MIAASRGLMQCPWLPLGIQPTQLPLPGSTDHTPLGLGKYLQTQTDTHDGNVPFQQVLTETDQLRDSSMAVVGAGRSPQKQECLTGLWPGQRLIGPELRHLKLPTALRRQRTNEARPLPRDGLHNA